jgi:hypothetical protein
MHWLNIFMFTWKYLDIDNKEVEGIRQQYLDYFQTSPPTAHFFQTCDIGIKTFLNMPVFKTSVIYLDGNTDGPIHEDVRPGGQVLGLLIPLINCNDSSTEIYESVVEPMVKVNGENRTYNYYEPDNCKKIAEYVLTQPVLLNTSLPHCVFNYSNLHRVALAICFETDPWHLTN